MNRLKISQIIQSGIVGIIGGVVFGIFYATTESGNFLVKATVNGIPFGLGITAFDIIKSSKLSPWYYLVALTIFMGTKFYLQRLFGSMADQINVISMLL